MTADNMHISEQPQLNPGTISSRLLTDVQAERADGWTRMTRLYGPLVYHWCVRQGLQRADAEDIVQEVFQTVSRRVSGFRRSPENGTFRGWLRTITRHKIGDHLRAERRWAEFREGLSAAGECCPVAVRQASCEAEEDRELGEETRILYTRVLELIHSEFEERTWRAFYDVVVREMSPRHVAHDLGISVNAVYSARSRILRRVRDELRAAEP